MSWNCRENIKYIFIKNKNKKYIIKFIKQQHISNGGYPQGECGEVPGLIIEDFVKKQS